MKSWKGANREKRRLNNRHIFGQGKQLILVFNSANEKYQLQTDIWHMNQVTTESRKRNRKKKQESNLDSRAQPSPLKMKFIIRTVWTLNRSRKTLFSWTLNTSKKYKDWIPIWAEHLNQINDCLKRCEWSSNTRTGNEINLDC